MRRRRLVALAVAIAIDLAILAVLATLPFLFLWRLLSLRPGDAAVLPPGDFHELHLPYRRWVVDQLLAGRFPTWNPYVSAGHPSLGDPQFGVYYPMTWLLARLNPAGLDAVGLVRGIAMHLGLASVFTYLFARVRANSRLAGVVAALVFTYGGYLTTFPLPQVIILEASVWLPPALLLLLVAARRRDLTLYAAAGLPLGVSLLAGHPQTAGYVWVGALLYALCLALDGAPEPRRLVGPFLTLTVGLGVGALQLAPLVAHLAETSRPDVPYEFTRSGFAPRELLGLLWPGPVGGQSIYLGVATLALVAAALLRPRLPRDSIFWLVLTGATLALALGGNAFLQPALYATLPGLGFFRNHERTIFLTAVAAAVLAGDGARALAAASPLRWLTAGRLARPLWQATALLWVTAALFLYGAQTAAPPGRDTLQSLLARATFAALVATLVAVVASLATRRVAGAGLGLALTLIVGLDLMSTNWHHHLREAHPTDLFPHTQPISFIRAVRFEDVFRVATEGLLPGDGNFGSYYALEDLVGNSPLEIERYRRFERAVPELERLRLLNVRYVVSKRQIGDPRLVVVSPVGEATLYELSPNLRLPRAYLVHRATVVPTDDDAHQLAQRMALGDEVALDAWPGELDGQPPDRDARAVVGETLPDNPAELRWRTRSARPAVLVTAEIDYPGWEVRIDGTPARPLRAFGLLRAVYVPPGEHEVVWTFEAPGKALGRRIALAALGLFLATGVAGAVWSLRKRPRVLPAV